METGGSGQIKGDEKKKQRYDKDREKEWGDVRKQNTTDSDRRENVKRTHTRDGGRKKKQTSSVERCNAGSR